MSDDLFTSPSLLDGMRQQNAEAWQRFTFLYAPLVYSWGRKAGLQADDVSDVTQEVFQIVFGKLDRFDPEHKKHGAFRSWLYGITRIAILDHRRNEPKQAIGQGGTDAHMAMQQVFDDEDLLADQPDQEGEIMGIDRVVFTQMLKLIKQDFADDTWQAFWQTAIAGRKSSEVAEEFGMSKPAVRQAKYRIMRRLREELEGLI